MQIWKEQELGVAAKLNGTSLTVSAGDKEAGQYGQTGSVGH